MFLHDIERCFDAELYEVFGRIGSSQAKYGDFASTHEALGVALEEWTELVAAIHSNRFEAVREEALDLAAVLLRLANQCRTSETMKARSQK